MSERDQWLAERIRGVGGSDAAAALGLSKWKTPYQLYLEKRGEAAPTEETEPMRWGKLLEPVVIQRYSEVTGRTVMRSPYKIEWSKDAPWMFCTPDGISGERGVEAKTARSREGWGEPGTDAIPQDYVIQVQHFLLVKGLPVCDVPVLFGGQEFEIYEVPADPELQTMIRDGEHDFWQMVKRGTPPDPITVEDATRRYGKKSVPFGVQADAVRMQACDRLRSVKDMQKKLEADEEALKVQIMGFMGENDALLHGRDILATWKIDKSGRFDGERFKAENPELHAAYIKPPSRRFLLK